MILKQMCQDRMVMARRLNQEEKGNPTMRYKSAILASDAAHTTKYAQAAVAALVVALILGAFVAPLGVAAQLDPIQRGIDAGSERYQAMALAGIQRGIEASSARLQAMGLDYLAKAGDGTPSDLLAAKFRLDYAQYRGHRGGAETNVLAENPELLLSRRFSSTLPYTDVSKFYAERMRVLAHGGSAVACTLDKDYATLAANPELVYAAQAEKC